MRRTGLSGVVCGIALASAALSVQAYHCPNLVQECRALVAKMEARADTDKEKVAQAKQGCENAQALHEQGDHKGSVIEAGEAISLAGASAN